MPKTKTISQLAAAEFNPRTIDDQALAGDVKAIEVLNKKFEEMKVQNEPESFIDRQLALLRKRNR